MHAKMRIKSLLSKLNFFLGRKPRLLPYPENVVNKFIPSPYKAAVNISCDFELAWAWRFSRQINYNLEKTKEIARRERENISLILELSKNFDIPITWVTVGHLFLKGCSKENSLPHKDMPRLKYFENAYWRFNQGDWFDQDPCCHWQDALEWYAPDLIEKIINSKVKHEVSCHTFSHIDCREEVCSKSALKTELQMCKEAASAYGIELKSFVFPGGFIGNLEVLKEEKFVSYRIDKDVLGFPLKDRYGLWQIPTTAEIAPSSYNWGLDYYIKRYRTIIERAIKFRRLCSFWFHPSMDKNFLEKVLGDLFKFMNEKRQELYITTIKDYIAFLEKRDFKKTKFNYEDIVCISPDRTA